MSHWITKILFFLFVAFTTYFVANFAEASKVIDFLREEKEEYLLSDSHLVQSTVISNYHDGTNAYVKIEPLYSEKFVSYQNNNITYSANIRIYSYVSFKNNTAFNSVAFIIDDIIVSDVLAVLDEKNRPIIDVKINFTEPIVFNDFEYEYSKETFAFVLDTNTAIFIINHDVLKNGDSYSEIESMEFSYRILESNDNVSLVNISNEDYVNVSLDGKFDDSFNRNLNKVINSNIDLLSTVSLNDFINNDNIYFDDSLIDSLNSFNKYYFRYILIEFLILIPLTYLLFFHKQVMVKYKMNKEIKNEKLNKFKENLLNKDK